MQIEANARALIERQRVARLGTVDAAGRPHVVPVTFALVGERLYSAIDEKPKTTTRLRRLSNIASEPRVTVLFDEYDEDWSRLGWVMAHGVAGEVADEAERARAFSALRDRYPQYARMALEQRPLLRIDIERVLSWSATDAKRGGTRRPALD